MTFGPEPPAPGAKQLRNAHRVLTDTLATVNFFLHVYERRVGRAATDHDDDLLRGMLVSACSGLDAMVKHAVRDALPAAIDRVDAANGKSLRSREEILRAASFFGLQPADLIVDTGLFDDALRARNQIAHATDIDIMRPQWNAARNSKQRAVDYTEAVLDCAAGFLVGVDAKLSSHWPKPGG